MRTASRDVLEPTVFREVQAAAEAQLAKATEEQNNKLKLRYETLLSYIDSRRAVWTPS